MLGHIELDTNTGTVAAIPLPEDIVVRRGPKADEANFIAALQSVIRDISWKGHSLNLLRIIP